MPDRVRKLTGEEITMIRYFHTEKGDLTRWVGWEDARPSLEEWYPELLKAWRDHVAAERILDAVVYQLEVIK